MWLNITYSQVPSPGVVWTCVSVVWVLLRLSVCALFGWAVHTHLLPTGAGLWSRCPPLWCPSPWWPCSQRPCVCILPTSHGRGSLQGSLLIPWHYSWATSGIAGLSWRLLLCSLCCFIHYLWLTWGHNAAVQGKTALNIQTVLWAWVVKVWHTLDLFILLYYFNTLIVTGFKCISFVIILENISVFKNFEDYNSSLNSCFLWHMGKINFPEFLGHLGNYIITFLFYLLVTWGFLIHQIFFGDSLSPRQLFSGRRWAKRGLAWYSETLSWRTAQSPHIGSLWFVMGQWILQSDLKAVLVDREPHLLREKFLQASPACDRVSNNHTSRGKC